MDRAVAVAAGDRWFQVWACPDHLEGLTGLREFGPRTDELLSVPEHRIG